MRPLPTLAPLFVLPLLLAPGRCPAADPPQVRVTVVAILASERNKNVEEKLKCVAGEVQKMYPNLTGFRVGPSTTKPIALGGSEKFKLVDDQEVTISVKPCTEKPGRFCLDVKSPEVMGGMVYSSVCGKYFPIVTQYKTKKSDQLIIAFKVETCADAKDKEKGKK
jgi:hypothetical protein